jgi:hypothetical protein
VDDWHGPVRIGGDGKSNMAAGVHQKHPGGLLVEGLAYRRNAVNRVRKV